MMVKPAVYATALDVHTLSRRKDISDCPIGKSKAVLDDSGSKDSLMQCKSKCKCFGVHSLEDMV